MPKVEDQQAILNVLGAIPPGSVCTYGQVAKLAGQPGKARLVAYILKHLPADSSIPWHRVINAQGRIAFPRDSLPFMRQKALLEAEKVVFSASDSINLQHFLWPK